MHNGRTMKLDRTIELYEPGRVIRDSDRSRARADATVHRIQARRQARQGAEGIDQDIHVGQNRITYTIRAGNLSRRIDTTWWISDGGLDYRIESVYEPPIGRRQFLALVTVARDQ